MYRKYLFLLNYLYHRIGAPEAGAHHRVSGVLEHVIQRCATYACARASSGRAVSAFFASAMSLA